MRAHLVAVEKLGLPAASRKLRLQRVGDSRLACA
jgi:hypothetical protein